MTVQQSESTSPPPPQPGDELPPLRIPVTTTLIVHGAIASQDLYPGHHDRDFAIAHGMPDVFLNILSMNGLVGRYLTDWAGPGYTLSRLKIRLGVPNLPGDTVTLTGSVLARNDNTVTVAVRGASARGDHVTGEGDLTIGSVA